MHVKLTGKGLSIPPLVSTTWDNIFNLSANETVLTVKLKDGTSVEIPNLTPNQIQIIFDRHQRYLDKEEKTEIPAPKSFRLDITPIDASGKIGFTAFDELGAVLQHNPAHANSPLLPTHVVEKIAMLAQTLPPTAMEGFPTDVPNCNCMHCQITRALMKGVQPPVYTIEEEIVSDEELQFSEWSITEKGEGIYIVTSKLNSAENYQVYLGTPIGCTCGDNKCEHIVAVLKS